MSSATLCPVKKKGKQEEDIQRYWATSKCGDKRGARSIAFRIKLWVKHKASTSGNDTSSWLSNNNQLNYARVNIMS